MQILSSPYQISVRFFYSPQIYPFQPSDFHYSPPIARIKFANFSLSYSNFINLHTSQSFLSTKHENWLLKCIHNENEHSSQQGSILTESQEAVSELLQECGASREDSVNIASNCNKYLEMLVDSVKELDEHSLWSSWSNEIESGGEEDIDNSGFKKKVYYMAKSKRDGGILPFLESAGVKYSSAVLIARYMSSVKLPDLIIKAGVEDRDIGVMLLKYPWILSTSIQGNYENIFKLFHDKKVPKYSVEMAIKSWPHLLGSSTKKLEVILDEINKLGINEKMLVPIIISSPQLLLRKSSEFLQVVSFMKEIGFDDRTTGRILCRSPEIFAANVDDNLRKKVKYLTDFGILRSQLPRVIRKYPELLLLDFHRTLLPRLRYLMLNGLSKSNVCSMVFSFSPLLGYSIDLVLKPKLEFFKNTIQQPKKELVEYPRYFSYSLEEKIKYRFMILESKNVKCSLMEMLAKNDYKFAEQHSLQLPPSSLSKN